MHTLRAHVFAECHWLVDVDYSELPTVSNRHNKQPSTARLAGADRPISNRRLSNPASSRGRGSPLYTVPCMHRWRHNIMRACRHQPCVGAGVQEGLGGHCALAALCSPTSAPRSLPHQLNSTVARFVLNPAGARVPVRRSPAPARRVQYKYIIILCSGHEGYFWGCALFLRSDMFYF